MDTKKALASLKDRLKRSTERKGSEETSPPSKGLLALASAGLGLSHISAAAVQCQIALGLRLIIDGKMDEASRISLGYPAILAMVNNLMDSKTLAAASVGPSPFSDQAKATLARLIELRDFINAIIDASKT